MATEFLERFGYKVQLKKSRNKLEFINKLTHLYLNGKNIEIIVRIKNSLLLFIIENRFFSGEPGNMFKPSITLFAQ